MNEHFVRLKSCLPSSTSSNDKARTRIGHFETGSVLCAVQGRFWPLFLCNLEKTNERRETLPKMVPHCSSTQNQPVTRATLKWPILKKENKKRGETGRWGGEKHSYLVSFTTKQQPVRRSKSHSFRNRIPTTNAAVIYLQTFVTLLMHTKIHSSPFEVWKIRSLPLERNVNRTRAQFLRRSSNFSGPKPYIKIKNQKNNPVTARVLDGDLRGYFNFWVSGQNPMVWPFKWKLSSCTYTWC